MARPLIDDALDALPVGLLVFDARGFVRSLNRRGQRILDRSASAVGANVAEVFAPLDILVAERDADYPASIDVYGADGLPRHVSFTVGRDRERHWVVAFNPATDGAPEPFRERTDAPSPISDVAPGAPVPLGSLNDVLPSLLHELRNPLAAMTSTVELLVEETPPGPLRSELEAVLVEGRRMDLSFQGIGMAGRSLRSRRLQRIEPAVHEVVHTMRSAATRAGVFLWVDAPPMPAMHVNAAVVRAMLYNVIHNAITACRAGDEVRVRVGVTLDGLLALTVRDTGAGMSEEVLAQCTDLFYSTKPHGSGLGLSLCRRAVEEVGGRCIVLSSVGRGTQVVLEVPTDEGFRGGVGR